MTSSSSNALPSDSIGTAWRILPKTALRRRADSLGRAVAPHEFWKRGFQCVIAPAQVIVFGI